VVRTDEAVQVRMRVLFSSLLLIFIMPFCKLTMVFFGTWARGPAGAAVGFYLREAFQSQTLAEKILYNESR